MRWEGGGAAARPSPQRSVLFYCCVYIHSLIYLFTLHFPCPRLRHEHNEYLAAAVAAAYKPHLPRDFLWGARRRGDRRGVGWGRRKGRQGGSLVSPWSRSRALWSRSMRGGRGRCPSAGGRCGRGRGRRGRGCGRRGRGRGRRGLGSSPRPGSSVWPERLARSSSSP